jgi:type IV secretion system protein VirB11
MLTADPNHIASRVLRKLSKYYLIDAVEEVIMNRPGFVWVKKRRGEWEQFEAPELDYQYVYRLCRVLANINSAKFSEDDLPVVSCELPGAPYRFQAVVGPNVRYDLQDRKGVAMAIRALTADTSINFSSYGLTGTAVLPGATSGLTEFSLSEDHIESLNEVIGRHESIIISGATSTGKTTFTNKLIEMISEKDRIITVEDARELTVHQKNRVHLVVPRNRSANSVDYSTIIDALVRLTPDWIICGELSIANAQPIYATMGKGHPVVTTVHAGSPLEAVGAFANNMNISGADTALSGDSLLESIRSQIGAIIQLDRRDGMRKVVEIVFPSREVAQERNSR